MMVNHSLVWTSVEAIPKITKADYGESIFVIAVIEVVGIAREREERPYIGLKYFDTFLTNETR
jgi:hypothetical protein